MEQIIEVIVNGKPEKLPVSRKGVLLSSFLQSLCYPLDMPCGGRAACKKCLVRASGTLSEPSEAELKLLTAQDLQTGYRLSCLTRILGRAEIHTAEEAAVQVLTVGENETDYGRNNTNRFFTEWGAAIDIGTTTVCIRLFGEDGTFTTRAIKNPQTAFGADVITRIEKALGGQAQELAHAICGAIAEGLSELAAEKNIQTAAIDGVLCTGNTTMLYLLTGESVEPLSHSPFIAEERYGCLSVSNKTMSLAAAFGVADNAAVYLPRCISAFVGADISTAILASGMCEKDETSLLVDLGTNGEIALWHEGKLYVCSTAAGPAFEGAGISCGCYSIPGAIDRIHSENGQVRFSTLGPAGTPPRGVCGSGIVDAVAVMLELEIIDETGAFQDDEETFTIGGDVEIIAQDVRQVQLAKGSVRAGVETLIEVTGLNREGIAAFYIAGGFGNYLNLRNASAIGLIPPDLLDRAKVIGNAALAGASMILFDRDRAGALTKLADTAETVHLDANPTFTDNYMEYMMFE